jgi:hypothetical protein
MLVGHLAAALVTKRVEPRLPLGAAVAAAFGLDLIWPLFLLLGLESVRIQPGDTAFTHLSFVSYPWSHSLLAVIGWSGVACLLGRSSFRAWRAGVALGLLVLSHWFLDFVTHRPDLPLWPGGPLAGLGLWNSVAGTILVEGSLLALGLWMYLGSSAPRDATGRWAFAALAALLGLIWVTQPWSPPPPSASAVAWGGLALWLLPPWARWIEAHTGPRAR